MNFSEPLIQNFVFLKIAMAIDNLFWKSFFENFAFDKSAMINTISLETVKISDIARVYEIVKDENKESFGYLTNAVLSPEDHRMFFSLVVVSKKNTVFQLLIPKTLPKHFFEINTKPQIEKLKKSVIKYLKILSNDLPIINLTP
eukprot:Pgem_evm1s20318